MDQVKFLKAVFHKFSWFILEYMISNVSNGAWMRIKKGNVTQPCKIMKLHKIIKKLFNSKKEPEYYAYRLVGFYVVATMASSKNNADFGNHLFSTSTNFSEKLTFLTPWFRQVCKRSGGKKCYFFRKLFLRYKMGNTFHKMYKIFTIGFIIINQKTNTAVKYNQTSIYLSFCNKKTSGVNACYSLQQITTFPKDCTTFYSLAFFMSALQKYEI